MKQTSPSRDAGGFTLVEMMVALVAGLIVSAALVAFMLSSMKSNGEYVQSTRLTQELRNTLDLVTRDLSRAGYNDSALTYVSLARISPNSRQSSSRTTPFVTAGNATTYLNADTDGCVLYAYDRTFPIGYADNTDCDDVTGWGTSAQIDLNLARYAGFAALHCVQRRR